MNSNTAVDGTKLRKKVPHYQKVDIERAIDSIEMEPSDDNKTFTRNAEILVYENKGSKQSALGAMLSLMNVMDNKRFAQQQKLSDKKNSEVVAVVGEGRTRRSVRLTNPLYKRAQMSSFFRLLDLMLLEVQNTVMHSLLTK